MGYLRFTAFFHRFIGQVFLGTMVLVTTHSEANAVVSEARVHLCANIGETTASSFITVEGEEVGMTWREQDVLARNSWVWP